MLSLVNAERGTSENEEKQMILNKIIAAGLNSLAIHASQKSDSEERKVLENFVSQSFENIIPCWQFLDDKIKFFVFKIHAEEFAKYMTEKQRGNANV